MFRASAKVLRRRPPLLLPAAGHFSQTTFCYSSSSSSSSSSVVRIGCASGFWGDTPTASDQLIRKGNVDYLIFDYLSELTMSLLTAAQAKKPELGFAPDFVKSGIGPYLRDIKDKGTNYPPNFSAPPSSKLLIPFHLEQEFGW